MLAAVYGCSASSAATRTLHEAHSQVLQHNAITASKERQHILDEVLLSTCTHTQRSNNRRQCRLRCCMKSRRPTSRAQHSCLVLPAITSACSCALGVLSCLNKCAAVHRCLVLPSNASMCSCCQGCLVLPSSGIYVHLQLGCPALPEMPCSCAAASWAVLSCLLCRVDAAAPPVPCPA